MVEQQGSPESAVAREYPPGPRGIPSVHEESGHYALAFARDREDLRRIQKLRFEVFNLEMCEGLDKSYSTCRDEDIFDDHCHHMMVTDKRSGDVIGTYRMLSLEMADTVGFYSAAEFDLSPLEHEFLPFAIELGRASIALEHRNSRVLFLLWRGLAAYMLHNRKRFFFGCCSLTSQDPILGWRVHRHLEARGHLDPRWRVVPQIGFECAADGLIGDGPVKVPKLMRTYMQYGARIAGPPAIDRQFKTIDFLTVFDLNGIDERIRRMFLD